MANNNNDNNNKFVKDALQKVEGKMITSAMLTPYNANSDNIEKEKERAVNPMAIRPAGINVTLTEQKPNINVIKKLFGF